MNDLEPHNRSLVREAITDIQGSIHANDNKSAAGLIVHGLLATAVVTLASQLGLVYEGAPFAAQVIIKLALGGTLLLAILSIACLIIAVRPYEPRAIGARVAPHSQEVFFPDIRELTRVAKSTAVDELAQLRPKFEALSDADKLDDEYLTELLKVADIRATEADWTKRGFLLLGLEICLVAIYLATVGCISGNLLGAGATQARVVQHSTSLRWDVDLATRQQSVSGTGKVALSGMGQTHVRLDAHDASGLKAVQLAATTTLRCLRTRGRSRSTITRLPTQRALLPSASSVSLETTLTLARRQCADKPSHPARISTRLAASARSDSGELRTATLTLVGP